MDSKIRKKIISEYLSGKGSTTIEKELKISKPLILKVLREEGITRKRDRCKSLNIEKKGGIYFVVRNCDKCGEEIKTTSKDKIIACRNHFNNVKKISLCRKCISDSCKGDKNKFYGKSHTNETKTKISNSRKGKSTGIDNAMANPMWRKKASQNLIKRWESGDLEETRKKMSETLKKTRKLGKIKSVIVSKAEKEIKDRIKKLGFDVIGSYRVETKICDIYVPSLNLIIEYNGDYWHCNPNKYDSSYFNKKKNMFAWQMWDYDKKKLELIKNYGYNLEIIWESDFKNDNKLLTNIFKKYDKNKHSTPEWSPKD